MPKAPIIQDEVIHSLESIGGTGQVSDVAALLSEDDPEKARRQAANALKRLADTGKAKRVKRGTYKLAKASSNGSKHKVTERNGRRTVAATSVQDGVTKSVKVSRAVNGSGNGHKTALEVIVEGVDGSLVLRHPDGSVWQAARCSN